MVWKRGIEWAPGEIAPGRSGGVGPRGSELFIDVTHPVRESRH
jgi:hypothetical protein